MWETSNAVVLTLLIGIVAAALGLRWSGKRGVTSALVSLLQLQVSRVRAMRARPALPGHLCAHRRVRTVDEVKHLGLDGQVDRKNIVLSPGHFEAFDPFLIMAEDFFSAPGGFDDHPHRGFEAISIVLQGAVQHADSRGHSGVLRAGGVQWMTAGSGLVHRELPFGTEPTHMLQLWLNLPPEQKFTEPRYQTLQAADIPKTSNATGTAIVDVISGRQGSVVGPIQNHVPTTMVRVRLEPGAEAVLEMPAAYNAFAYVIEGSVLLGANATPVSAGQVAWLAKSSSPAGATDAVYMCGCRTSSGRPALVLLAGGEPIGAPVVHRGPFVMNTSEQIRQAFEDYRAGRLGRIAS